MAGFHHLDEFYAVNSSCNYINEVSDKFWSAEEDAFLSPLEAISHFPVAVNLIMKPRLSAKEQVQCNAGELGSFRLPIWTPASSIVRLVFRFLYKHDSRMAIDEQRTYS